MTENKPGFSVIIPVYNGAAYIDKAIRSCLMQTTLPDEIIVIDDASGDETAAIIKSLNSDLVKYFRNEKNSGPSFSRNRGMKLATSSWIMFLDADDVFHPEKINTLSKIIESNKSIKAIGHGFGVTTNQNDELPQSIQEPHLLSTHQVLLRNPVVTPALSVAASNHILFNEEMSYAEDHDFIVRTTEQFGLWYVDLPLCSLQRLPLTPGGLSDNKWKMRKGEMKMYIDYSKRHKKYITMPFLLLFSLMKHLKQILIPRSLR